VTTCAIVKRKDWNGNSDPDDDVASVTSAPTSDLNRNIAEQAPRAHAEKPHRRRLLARDEIAVWWMPTDTVVPGDLHRWFETLDEHERQRSASFHFEMDRRDFVAAHALLRSILTYYANLPLHSWRFVIEANGKPRIAPDLGCDELLFNLSHTRGLVAVAVASRGMIGIDVERIDPAKVDIAVAEEYFAPAELQILQEAPPAERTACFFRLWTLKEAYIKAIGTGLCTPLNSFAFAFEPIRIDFGLDASTHVNWQFASLAPTDQHVLSVAMGRAEADIVRRTMRAVAPQSL
jgi:4'-phosphopantetheinyl transferase